MVKELNQIYNMDCLDGMREIGDKTVDLTVTSPPYDNLREYKGYKGYSLDFVNLTHELFRITKVGGVVVWVVGDAIIDGSESGTSFKQALYFKEIGFNLHDTMIYQKNCYPFPPSNRYFGVFEYMFVFSKNTPKTTNLIRVKTKNKEFNPHSTNRQENGNTIVQKYECGKYSRIKDNIWKYDVGYNKSTKDEIAYDHPATFPEQLANDHIISWSNKGDLVMDPFMGSGTTAKMAIINERNFIGFEISKEYCDIANTRIKNAQSQGKIGTWF
jgi:site-specific DNA-methyltransferase (adenine-specific)